MKILLTLKKRINKTINSYKKIKFNLCLNKNTKLLRNNILEQAEINLQNLSNHESSAAYLESPDPVVRQGHNLRTIACQKFFNCLSQTNKERVLIQVPDSSFSPAGYSLFTNLIESLNYIGVPSRSLGWHENTSAALSEFLPTVFLTSDHYSYLNRIDWMAIKTYRNSNPINVGLSASLQEDGNTPLLPRLAWSKKNGINFFYSFRDPDYIANREEYKPFYEQDFKILYIPFGANILHYYPVPKITRDLDYALIASRKREHISYLFDIARHYTGFIDGPGWDHIANFTFNKDRDRYIYARAKIGLNVHLPEQLNWACELNERTYQLAACGTPQLIDHPMLLDKIFPPNSLFVANSPSEYLDLFEFLLKNPELAQQAALLSLKEVFASHTTFHRAKSFIEQLSLL